MEISRKKYYKFARRVSDIGNAMTYSLVIGILFTFLIPQRRSPWLVFIVAFLIMIFSPALILGLAMKIWKVDFDFTERKSRTPYYSAIEICYISGIFVFSNFILPSWSMFCLAIVSTMLNGILTVVNLKWKISAHAAGSSGPTMGIAIIFGWWTLLITGPLLAAVLWSRYYLKKHTVLQLVCGVVAALVCYILVFAVIYPAQLF
ncbi:MAG: hypothetical protein ACTSRA_11600 [Promethearchaeota archaeon]